MSQPMNSYSTEQTVGSTTSNSTNTWLLVGMIFFIITAITFGVLYALVAPQASILLNDEPKVFSFSQIWGKDIVNDGVNAIACADGKKINIDSASYYVYDVYRQCYPTGDLAFPPSSESSDPAYTNADSTSNPNKSCGPYWTGSNGKITASGFTLEDADGKVNAGSTSVCPFDVDGGGVSGTEERLCWGGSLQCTYKNITQYVAERCKGKSSCGIKVDNSIGPAPCNKLMAPVENSEGSSDQFSVFPKSVKVTDPKNGSTPGEQQGYYVTGTFLCEV